MKVVFVIKEWRDSNLNVVKKDNVEDGIFSEGSVFSGNIHLEKEDEEALRKELLNGFYPIVLMNRGNH